MKEERWKMDDNWCLSNGKMMFYAGNIVSLSREVDKTITVILLPTKIDIGFKTNKDRDKAWIMFCKVKSEYHASILQKSVRNEAMAKASVEIQNRMAGHLVNSH